MNQVRIKGLVRLANQVRADLAGPVSSERLAELRQAVGQAVRTVRGALTRQGLEVQHGLSPQSRQAFQYLAALDFSRLGPHVHHEGLAPATLRRSAPRPSPARPRMRFPGLNAGFEALLEELAEQPNRRGRSLRQRIVSSSHQLEAKIRVHRLQPEQLSESTRAIRGWLAYFSEDDHFAAYTRAVALAHRAMADRLGPQRQFPPPPRVSLRPMHGLYRVRGGKEGTQIALPTPMIVFQKEQFEQLARMIMGERAMRRPIIEAMQTPAYQQVRNRLLDLRGEVDQAAGAVHDLAASFERVNQAYFDGRMPRPRLVWGGTLTRRKFGHFDHIHDTVMLSSTLDDPAVPAYVVDFVMYHELLHKAHGTRWRNDRMLVHTPGFKADERRFREYEQAEAMLRHLARRR